LLAEKDMNLKRLYIEVEDLRVGLKRKEDELKERDDEHQEQTRLWEEQVEGLRERIRAQKNVLKDAKAQMETIEV
jgi:hypothetical protein